MKSPIITDLPCSPLCHTSVLRPTDTQDHLLDLLLVLDDVILDHGDLVQLLGHGRGQVRQVGGQGLQSLAKKLNKIFIFLNNYFVYFITVLCL